MVTVRRVLGCAVCGCALEGGRLLVEGKNHRSQNGSSGGGGGYGWNNAPASSSFIELNPNYAPNSQYRVSKMYQPDGQGGSGGDFEEVYYSYSIGAPTQQQRSWENSKSIGLFSLARDATVLFPSLAATFAACWVVFVCWQIPACSTTLQRWFVASPQNLAQGRWLSLILSAVSHAGLLHIVLNLVTLVSFGPAVQRSLQSASLQRWPLWPLLLGSTLSGSAAFLAWQSLTTRDPAYRRQGGCMGLSAVTCALIAVFGRMNPHARLNLLVAGVIPVNMTAQLLLGIMLGTTMLAMVAQQGSRVAHSAHFGGMLFGLAYFELWTRRYRLSHRVHQLRRHFFASSK